jgi:hypothetical protein
VNLLDLDYMTTNEAAELWNMKLRQVQWRCERDEIEGVIRVGRMFLIPRSAQKPIDGRTKAAKAAKAGFTNEGQNNGYTSERLNLQ